MHRRTFVTRAVASAAAVAFLASPAAAVAAPDPAPGDRSGVRPSATAGRGEPGLQAPRAAVDPADKITPAAARAFRAEGETDFWLRFAEEPDLSAAGGITSWSERGEYVHDTLVAAAEASQEQAIAALEKSGTEYTSFWATNAILVEDGSLDQAVDLAADTQVLEVRPTTRHVIDEPETTDGAVPNAAANSTYGIKAINADDVWRRGATGDGIVVAGLDSGVSRTHPALAAQYRGATSGNNYNWFDAARVGASAPRDDHGHGTHTMGTMVGTDDGAMNIGVAPGAQWIATNGCADDCADAALIASGQWILAPTRLDGSAPDAAQRPHVVNNSWGLSFSTDPFMEDVISAWEAAGIFSTWANGNEGEYGCESSGSPGSRTLSYSVGAFTPTGAIASFSSRGPGQSGTVKPDIAAPGEKVRSAVPGGRYEQWSGTSMAAPHVAGAVALLWDAVPELVGDVTRTRAILDGSAADVRDTSCGGTTDDNNVWGEGKLDVLAAYELAQAQAFAASPEPVVSGAQTKVGVQLTATVPAWSPAASFTYQWRRDGAKILGATKNTYTPRGADAGSRLSVTVLGSATGRTPTARTSAETAVVAPGVMTATRPTISPAAKVGTTLYAKSGAWTSGTTFTYQWLANGTPVSGARSFTFVPTSSHRGKQLTVTITGKRPGYVSETRTSPAVTVGYGTFSARYPRIIGNVARGATVKASTPQWVPARSTTSYTWKIDGRAISGATGSSFRVPSSYATGRVLTVTVKGQRAGFTTKSLESIGYKVGKPYTRAPFPKLSGTARVGSVLTLNPGTWSPSAGLSYRWFASGEPIAGVTGKTYRLKGSDYGKEIVATVTARKSGYATTSRTTSPTAAVGKPLTAIPANGGYLVGSGSVAAGTYVAAAGSRSCAWTRESRSAVLGADFGSGQRIATVKSTDYGFWSDSCGPWAKYYSGMTKPRTSTAANGVYVLGDQLQRGVYVTTGPADPAAGVCYYAVINEFTGLESRANLASYGEAADPRTITLPSGAKGFETLNCTWRRVS
ncbi:S8 family serine peptidase [Promicromonospora iranensis]|uniref:Subtilisin family serine protease n=1 Tax=Promicromonospora iranensis TaxID=1105144 RepID=A0ABU2CQF8_9MICO|nr:S8 family serine peptidase [Promicromonospora iranensis]MDR7383573.1 subtilisin family serine protease [Promicromonospora iranensis]